MGLIYVDTGIKVKHNVGNMENLLKGTTCTVIGAMQYSADGRNVREYIGAKMAERGITVYDHYNKPFIDAVEEHEDRRDYMRSLLEKEDYDAISSLKNIRTFDLKLIDISDFIVFVFDPKVLTCGSWEEFFLANRNKRPIFFVNTAGKKNTPFWVFWTIPHKYIYSSVEEMLRKIDDIDTGKHPIDNERWKLLKMEYR